MEGGPGLKHTLPTSRRDKKNGRASFSFLGLGNAVVGGLSGTGLFNRSGVGRSMGMAIVEKFPPERKVIPEAGRTWIGRWNRLPL